MLDLADCFFMVAINLFPSHTVSSKLVVRYRGLLVSNAKIE